MRSTLSRQSYQFLVQFQLKLHSFNPIEQSITTLMNIPALGLKGSDTFFVSFYFNLLRLECAEHENEKKVISAHESFPLCGGGLLCNIEKFPSSL